MADTSQGPGWWQASDGKWYSPEQRPQTETAGADAPASDVAPGAAATGGHGATGKPRKTGLTILVSIVTLGIWTLLWSYWNGEELRKYRGEGIGGVLYLVFTLLLSPITMFLMANEVEKLYRAEGEEPQITTIWGLWFLLPLIGHIVWYVRIQGALNSFWEQRGSGPATGIV